jgi:hypothetical protein
MHKKDLLNEEKEKKNEEKRKRRKGKKPTLGSAHVGACGPAVKTARSGRATAELVLRPEAGRTAPPLSPSVWPT